MNITWDLLFSYWLFFWFLIYYIVIHFTIEGKLFNFIKTAANPIVGLIVASIENIITLLLLIYKNNSFISTITYLFAILLFKVIPIYLLKDYDVHVFYSSIAFLIVFLIYLVYVIAKHQNPLEIYKTTFDSILLEQKNTPFFKMASTLSKFVFL
jgi:hypothetical protein